MLWSTVLPGLNETDIKKRLLTKAHEVLSHRRRFGEQQGAEDRAVVDAVHKILFGVGFKRRELQHVHSICLLYWGGYLIRYIPHVTISIATICTHYSFNTYFAIFLSPRDMFDHTCCTERRDQGLWLQHRASCKETQKWDTEEDTRAPARVVFPSGPRITDTHGEIQWFDDIVIRFNGTWVWMYFSSIAFSCHFATNYCTHNHVPTPQSKCLAADYNQSGNTRTHYHESWEHVHWFGNMATSDHLAVTGK